MRDVNFEHSGANIDIKPPRRQGQVDRNNSLRDLLKKVHESGRSQAKTADIGWLSKPRTLKIGDDIIYEESAQGVGGKWTGAYADWH